jgi:hypothetical protein
MKRKLSRNMLTLFSAISLGSASSFAQTPQQAEAADALVDDDVVMLDPFTVTTETLGYRTVDTLGGSRVRTDLADTAASLTVVNTRLMQDLNITKAEDLYVYTTNTEVSGISGNYSGLANRGFGIGSEASRLTNPAGTNRMRGLSSMDNARNYMNSSIPWDGFNISRVDISRGPNSFLFGVGSPSGISNVSTNNALFDDSGSVEAHYGSYGSTRGSIDVNKVILENELAVRIDLVSDQRVYQQQPAFNDSKRVYAAVRYDPSFLNTSSSHTKIEFNFESGEVDSNNPRMLPPLDYVSGYYDDETNKNGYDPFAFQANDAGVDPNGSPWVSNSNMYGYAWGNNATYYFDAATGNVLYRGQTSLLGNNFATNTYVGGGTSWLSSSTSVNAYNLYTTGFNRYAIAKNLEDPDLYPGAYARTITYLDQTLSDTSIFDFYNKLIDGDNKREWQDWNAYNLSIVQSFFDYTLNIQAVVSHEDYTSGSESMLPGSPYISVDMNTYQLSAYPSWTSGAIVNENVGRPFIANYTASGSEYDTERDNAQITTSYSLRFKDIMDESLLTRILGRWELTGLVGRYETNKEQRNFQSYRTDEAFATATHHGLTVGESNPMWVAYLGDSLIGTTASDALNLSNLATTFVPTSGSFRMWDGTWTAASTVDPADPWTTVTPLGTATLTEAGNPYNYTGYRDFTASVINWRDTDQLYTDGSNKSRETLTSAAFMFQGYLWDDAIVPSIGVRRDKVRQQGTSAPKDSTTNVVSLDYSITDPGTELYTTSTSYGIAVHTAKLFPTLLPKGDDITFFYFHGSNQTPRVRYSTNGEQLPNEEGETDDISVQYDGFDGRFSARLTYFKTVDKYAPLTGQALGSQTWLLDSLPVWTLTFAAQGAAAATMTDAQLPADMLSNSWSWGWARTHPEAAVAMGEILKTEFVELFPQSYWDAYGIGVDVEAIKNGDWLNILTNGQWPMAWNVANSHLIHGTSPVVDQDIEAKGYELELTFRPLRNWDISFNASKLDAYQTALGEGIAEYLTGLAHLMLETDLGNTPQWGNYDSGQMSNLFLSGLWSPYLLQTALTGTSQPEVRKWNFKIISNYNFESGLLEGFKVGGAFRWASKQIVGYGITQAEVFGETEWVYDVNQPIYGDTDHHLDMWIGYQTKLNDDIDWSVQLNLRNVGEDDGLVTIAVQPDGTPAQQRISEGMTYDLSMRFSF